MKPKSVKAKITRVVTETVTLTLDRSGNVEEITDIHEEHEYEVTEVHSVLTVISEH